MVAQKNGTTHHLVKVPDISQVNAASIWVGLGH